MSKASPHRARWRRVAGAVVRDALRIRREVLAHDDGLVSGVGWCIFCFLPALEV